MIALSDHVSPRIGPDPAAFRGTFGVGADDERIHPVDRLGVALAAIQGLHALVEQREHELERLRAEVAAAEEAAVPWQRPPDDQPGT